MKNILRSAKILNITHVDFDGSVCAIILSHIFKNITILDTSFYKVDSILQNLDYSQYDYVFLTDIHPDKQENLYLSDKIILLDHHESALVMNDPSKMHFVVIGKCAAHLVKKFVEKYYNIKLSHLDDLVRLANDYDQWELKFPESKLMNDVMFYLYRAKKFREQFFDGRVTFTDKEKIWLKERALEFDRLYNSLSVFEFDTINGCIVNSTEFINEICEKLMKEEGYDVIFVRNPRNQRVSVRTRIEGLDTGGLLKSHGWGGGHFASSGFFTNDLNDFQMKASVLESEIAINYPKMNKEKYE